ncbi:hypothetical protein STCU_11355 [Strigomonas culicis]|uniref:Uncharacterized protein n=1 Tax=Strigomonas culicis TaxID=28005 RepID=S9V0N4_9TRYP|nr:hypothetical protein STCU_11355 [Strigomonas culicis]|eukprot:EPY16365.1 hypothetical protein STCU_11355 [Strigomonas culicis]
MSNRSQPVEDESEASRGDRIIALTDLSEAILEAEPETPVVIIRELTENAVTGGRDMLVVDEERPAFVRLSEAIKVVNTAPIIPRSVKSTVEECTL